MHDGRADSITGLVREQTSLLRCFFDQQEMLKLRQFVGPAARTQQRVRGAMDTFEVAKVAGSVLPALLVIVGFNTVLEGLYAPCAGLAGFARPTRRERSVAGSAGF